MTMHSRMSTPPSQTPRNHSTYLWISESRSPEESSLERSEDFQCHFQVSGFGALILPPLPLPHLRTESSITMYCLSGKRVSKQDVLVFHYGCIGSTAVPNVLDRLWTPVLRGQSKLHASEFMKRYSISSSGQNHSCFHTSCRFQ